MSQNRNQKVTVYWKGRDIAPYLYGRSPRLLSPNKEYITLEDGIAFKNVASQISFGDQLFGVKLKPVTGISDFVVGTNYLLLNDMGRAYSKTIVKVTGIEFKNGATCVDYECLWPSWSKEHSGGFVADYMFDDKYGERIMFRRVGPMPEEDYAESFFAKVMFMAQEFSTLEILWRNARQKAHMPCQFWTPDQFCELHPEFRRTAEYVWNSMMNMVERESLVGINKVYDDGKKSYFREKDFVTPIMEVLRTDILDILWKHPEVAEDFFSDESRQYWGKYIEVLFHSYQTARAVVFVSDVIRTERGSESSEIRPRALKTILEILKRKDTTAPGYYQAALYAYERLTGRKFGIQ